MGAGCQAPVRAAEEVLDGGVFPAAVALARQGFQADSITDAGSIEFFKIFLENF